MEKEVEERFQVLVRNLREAESEEIRFHAVVSLEAMGVEAVEKAFAELVQTLHEDRSERLRSTTALVLGMAKEKAEEAVSELIRSIREDESEDVRAMVAMALGELEELLEGEVLPVLFSVLEEDKSDRVKISIAKVLRGMDKKEAIDPLRNLLKEEMPSETKFELAYSLAVLEGKEGEGIIILQNMYNNQELDEVQILKFEALCEELDIKELIGEVEDSVESVKKEIQEVKEEVETEPDSPGKNKFLSLIGILQDTNKQQEETIRGLQSALQQITKAHQLLFEQQATMSEVSGPLAPSKEGWWSKWSGEIIIGILGAITTIVTAIIGIIF